MTQLVLHHSSVRMKSADLHNMLLAELASQRLSISDQAVAELRFFQAMGDCPFLSIPAYTQPATNIMVKAEGPMSHAFSFHSRAADGEVTVEQLCTTEPLVPAKLRGQSRRTRVDHVADAGDGTVTVATGTGAGAGAGTTRTSSDGWPADFLPTDLGISSVVQQEEQKRGHADVFVAAVSEALETDSTTVAPSDSQRATGIGMASSGSLSMPSDIHRRVILAQAMVEVHQPNDAFGGHPAYGDVPGLAQPLDGAVCIRLRPGIPLTMYSVRFRGDDVDRPLLALLECGEKSPKQRVLELLHVPPGVSLALELRCVAAYTSCEHAWAFASSGDVPTTLICDGFCIQREGVQWRLSLATTHAVTAHEGNRPTCTLWEWQAMYRRIIGPLPPSVALVVSLVLRNTFLV